MLQNELAVHIRQALNEPLNEMTGGTPLGYRIRTQPIQAGRPTEPTIYFNLIANKRYGWPKHDGDEMRQILESTIQFSVQQPVAVGRADRTVMDVVDMLAMAMNSPEFISAMLPQVTTLRIGEVKQAPYQNDIGQWEQVPVFDAVFRHHQRWIRNVPCITRCEYKILCVPDFV